MRASRTTSSKVSRAPRSAQPDGRGLRGVRGKGSPQPLKGVGEQRKNQASKSSKGSAGKGTPKDTPEDPEYPGPDDWGSWPEISLKPFEPFKDRGFTFQPLRRPSINLTYGYDPRRLAYRLWRLVGKENRPVRLFLRFGEPVRVELIEGVPKVFDLTSNRLSQEVHRGADFVVFDERGQPISTTCPERLIREMLATPNVDIPLPTLNTIATAPVIGDEDGTMAQQNGYYRDIGTYLYSEAQVRPVSNAPMAREVHEAVTIIREPLQEFPFVNEASRTTAIAGMLLPFVRNLVHGPTPLHLIKKPTAGTGASLLVNVLLTPVIGSAVPKAAAPTSEHEWQYSMAALLKSLPPALVIDNARQLTSAQLAKVITDDRDCCRSRSTHIAPEPWRFLTSRRLETS